LTLTADTLSVTPDYFIRNQNGGPQTADWWINGMIRMGREDGTAEPAGTGIIVRALNSTDNTVGNVVAYGGMGSLRRDGSNGGFYLAAMAMFNDISVTCLGITSSGTVVTYNNQHTGMGTVSWTVFSDAQSVQSFYCDFGNYNSGSSTHVSLSRMPGSSAWRGFLQSTYNQ
jgi:hypothetical protein